MFCCIVTGFPYFYDPTPCGDRATRPRKGSFPSPPLAELDCGAPASAGDTEGCHAGQAWRGRADAGGRVALERAVPPWRFLKPKRFEHPKRHDAVDDYVSVLHIKIDIYSGAGLWYVRELGPIRPDALGSHRRGYLLLAGYLPLKVCTQAELFCFFYERLLCARLRPFFFAGCQIL